MATPKGYPQKKRKLGKVKLSDRFTDDSICLILSGLDCPRSLAIWMMYRFGEHNQILDLECDPKDYSEPSSFRSAYLSTCLLKKSTFLKVDVDRELAAIEKFLSQEQKNVSTNSRFRNLALDPQFKGPNVWLLSATQRKIAQVLEPVNPETLEEWFDACRWGPGSTTDIRGRDVSAANKFQKCTGITSKLADFLGRCADYSPLWDSHLNSMGGYSVTEAEEIICVPKKASIDRTIGIPVGINSFYQLGLGTLIRRRLFRRFRIDLNSQGVNGRLAFYGAASNKLATIDFSSASDSLSYCMVRELVPHDWFSLLEFCRVGSYRFSEKLSAKLDPSLRSVRSHELFSAMGCGFTFELESLIFAAAASAVCEYLGLENDVSVFGDDVIIPVAAVETYIKFCSFLGFTVNTSKSFSAGNFRESCGEHYFRRTDVKPFFIKERLRRDYDVFVLANRIRRWSRRNLSYGLDSRLYPVWRFLLSSIPENRRLLIPEGYGDGGFIVDFDEACPRTYKRAPFQIEGYSFKALVAKSITFDHCNVGRLLSDLHQMKEGDIFAPEGQGSDFTPNLRPGRIRYRVSWIRYAHRWLSFGPWLHQ